MDMYHGHLHEQYQTWTVNALEQVTRRETSIEARYAATGYYKIDRVGVGIGLQWRGPVPGSRGINKQAAPRSPHPRDPVELHSIAPRRTSDRD